MQVLSLSDKVIDFIYASEIQERFAEVDLVLGCGDLPYYYLEFVIDALDVPIFFVRGNHDNTVEYSQRGNRTAPLGAVDLHGQVVNFRGYLLAGLEGSLRYKRGPFMYSQREMWWNVFKLVPRLLANRMIYGRALDIFISHAPPAGIHDQEDFTHRGFRAFRWLLEVFKPAYHLHGHIHVYSNTTVTESRHQDTTVINTYGYRLTNIGLEGVVPKDVATRNL